MSAPAPAARNSRELPPMQPRTFIAKPVAVAAIQLRGAGDPDIKAVKDFVGTAFRGIDRLKSGLRLWFHSSAMYVDCGINVGDWVVADPTEPGVFIPVARVSFARHYVEAPPPTNPPTEAIKEATP